MTTSINIKSSSSQEVYTVVFNFENDLISINCNCKAGLVKSLCKHRLNLLGGDLSALTDSSDVAKVTEVLNQIDKTRVSGLYSELEQIENQISKLETVRKKLRKEIGLKFSNGF